MALNGNNDKVLPIVAKIGYPLNGRSFTVTGAKVGQTVKIAEVDSVGTPTAWEPTDFPTSGADVDFDGYATEEFVKNEIEGAKLDIKEADLVIVAPVPITMGGHHASGFVAGAGSISKACRKAHDTGEKPVVHLQCSGGSPEGVFREFCEITRIYMEEADDPANTRAVLDFVYRHAGSLYACTLVSQGENNILDNRFTEFECTELQESGNVDLTGYATENWVQEGYQPKGSYLTEVPEGYATEDFVEQSLARVKTGVLCVTVDYSTKIASHSPAEILEAVHSGKGVFLCVVSNGGTVVLSLVGVDTDVDTDSEKAVFCATVYDGLVFGHRLGIIHAVVRGDKTVTFANDGSVLSMCVPVAENTDVGKILGVTEDGLKWSEPPEGGVLQVTVDPASNLASHSPAEILEAANAGKTVQLLYHQSEEGASVLPLFQAWQQEAVFSATGYGGYDRGYYTRTQEAFVHSDRRVDFVNDGFFDSRCVPHFEPEDAGKYLAAGEEGLVWSAIPEGSNGKDGVSASHRWNGTVLTVTSASGTSSADLKGEKGDKGDPGAGGKDGVSPTVTVTDITGGHRVAVTDANGTKTFDVMDGRDGESGSGGSSGVPVIDLRELGFPEVDGPGYFENVMFNQTTYNTLKTKIEYGVAAIKLYAGVGTCTLTCHSEIYEMTSATEHRAVCISSDGYKYVFMLGCGDGLYGASFSMYDK